MVSQDTLYALIRAMLIDADLGVDPNSILAAYQSNLQLPKINSFITFAEYSRVLTSITPVSFYDGDNEIQSILTLNEIAIQVDYYGLNAPNWASIFFNYLGGYATDFISSTDKFKDIFSIGVISNILNLTEEWDREKFMQRYVQRFTIFMHQMIDKNVSGFDKVSTGIYFIP